MALSFDFLGVILVSVLLGKTELELVEQYGGLLEEGELKSEVSGRDLQAIGSNAPTGFASCSPSLAK